MHRLGACGEIQLQTSFALTLNEKKESILNEEIASGDPLGIRIPKEKLTISNCLAFSHSDSIANFVCFDPE